MEQPETILKGLSKYEFYGKLDNKDNNLEYSSYCTSVDDLESTYHGISELCSMYARNLITLPIALNEITDSVERCSYFIFWIHDKIQKKFNTDWKGKNYINYVLLQFFQVEQAIKANSQNNNCYYEYNANTGLNSWIEWKYLYDYIKNYDEIERKITADNRLCEVYQEYLGSIEKIYGDFKRQCCSGLSDKCPEPLESNEWCTESFKLRKFSCDKFKEVATSSDEYSAIPIGGEEQRGDEPHSVAFSTLENQLNTNGDGMSNNTYYYTKLGVSLPFIGIISTFVYLYNFTTFGTWIRTKLLGKSKMNLNLDDDAEHLLQHDSENIDLNTYNDDFNINYHSS
ncbi:PIR Superfamily Protein [Plasmodium ovale wallikeri]|uniref:PIR Superfamily Protein n=1 Tax=Plasmodium ovale wallikeri TaxID=864142 RepID=A0A1A9ARA9_PLAOA|nr:PIR Superfamily Protein [Plasmodium ovale wallikeri]